MTSKSILNVLSGMPVWPPPIWLMRQAGRYLPEFRTIRSQADFLTRCLTPDLATEITLQPIRRYAMDAAILFSDILIVPWGLGQEVRFVEGNGPTLEPIRTEMDLARLQIDELPKRVEPVMETVRRVRRALETDWPACTFLGFAGSPFTVACYMLDGAGGREFPVTRRLAYAEPLLFDRLIQLLIEATIRYLELQIEAGAEALVLFDSWSGLLPPPLFERAVMEPTRSIVNGLKTRSPAVPIIGFPRMAGLMIGPYAKRTRVDGIGLDTGTDLSMATTLVPKGLALQGNLDPLCLVAGGEAMISEADRIMTACRGFPHIFNLGHGVLPDTPPEHVAALVERVRRA